MNRPDEYEEIRSVIKDIYHSNKGRYGYRRITMELHNRGFCINHKTVLKLMNECGIKCKVRLHKYRSYKGEVGKIAPNILQRDFEADKPNQKWVTDVTDFSLYGTKLYLSPILDLFNGEIVSYMVEHFRRELDIYIDYYNNKRIKCKLKGLSPVQYRIQSQRVA